MLCPHRTLYRRLAFSPYPKIQSVFLKRPSVVLHGGPGCGLVACILSWDIILSPGVQIRPKWFTFCCTTCAFSLETLYPLPPRNLKSVLYTFPRILWWENKLEDHQHSVRSIQPPLVIGSLILC